ncbi:MAG: STAS domain-containing protein [Candidatus Dactylopiibacterium sp.]|nr:STAS domain-containing protein [Candidatus Dactylopiibacterium sp.]
MPPSSTILLDVLSEARTQILDNWLSEAEGQNPSESQREHARELLQAFGAVLRSGDPADQRSPEWAAVKKQLEAISASRAAQGSTSGETSAFVLALKSALFGALTPKVGGDPAVLLELVTSLTAQVDAMAQWTADAYQRSREDIITRQQHELLELSTPVVKLWDGVLAAPMIGTLDSSRTQLVMEALLQRIVETEASIAIIDITGVPTVDTLVAQHLLKTVTAIRLMGADCIISGIRPQIAQTIVHLGIDLQSVTSKATLADALGLAMKRLGYTFRKDS